MATKIFVDKYRDMKKPGILRDAGLRRPQRISR